jgi:hypothetical protein
MSRVIRSHEQNTKRRKKWILISVAVFVLLGAVLYDISWFAARPGFQIADIVISGNETTIAEEVKSETRKILSGKYFYLIPRTNIFFYPKHSLQTGLVEKFPQMQNVSLSLNSKRNLVISMSERKAVALWCGMSVSALPAEKTCYYLDENAFIFDDAPVFSGDVFFEFYGKGDAQQDDPLGKTFLEKKAFTNILDLHNLLEEYGQEVLNIMLSEDGSGEFGTKAGCVIRFNTDQPITTLTSNIDAVFHLYDWKNATDISKSGNVCEKLEYVDFRFGNKIYYRERGKEPSRINNDILETPTETPRETPPESIPLETGGAATGSPSARVGIAT